MERLTVYFTLDIHSVGTALIGYVVDSDKMETYTKEILTELFPKDLEFELEEFDIRDVCNKIINVNVNNGHTLENVVRVYDEYRLREWLIKDYSRSDLMKIANRVFSKALPCEVTAADIIPPRTLNLEVR